MPAAVRHRGEEQPIRGQYLGHVIMLDKSESSREERQEEYPRPPTQTRSVHFFFMITISHSTNQRPDISLNNQ